MDEVNQTSDGFCPYVGLQPYNEPDQDYFFGRERDSRIISSNLYAAFLTVLYGASGVGKTSILRAGVFPRLRASPSTAVVIFDGWSDQNLLSTLKAKCLEAIAEVTGNHNLPFDPDLPLDELLLSATQAFDVTLLIILDQFEEYFLYHPETEKDNTFDPEFAQAVNREDIDINFLLSMREDSLSKLDRFRTRIPNMLSNALRLRHLDAASAQDAMRKPLEVYAAQHPTEQAMSIEDALVEELIEEIQVEKLIIGQGGRGVVEKTDGTGEDLRIEAPFLQVVLTRLWNEERAQGSQVLRLETLHALGGAGRIIRTHMDSAMNALSPEEQEVAAGIFRYLVTPSGTKIAYTIADLEYYARSNRPLRPVLEKLAQGNVRIMRSVTSPGEPGVVRYQIYHDVLAPSVLDWRARFENSKQLLSLFSLLIEKGDMDSAFQIYQDIVQRTPQQAFFPERYEVRRILGKGELGISYSLFDREENRFLAATMLDPSYEFTNEELENFASEISRLSSTRISRILGFERHRENIYMLSELIDGPNLREHLSQGPLTYQEAIQIARQVTQALEDGHGRGLPHLNLRPSNIMLSSQGIKLVNYGISRLTSLKRVPTKANKRYMDDYLAPEQLTGQEGNERSDIYAVGTILYEMLIGHPPSVGRFYYPSEVNIEATEADDILIDHAREQEPARRFATAEEMRAEIDRISMSSHRASPNQVLRVALAWITERYKGLTSRRGLALLIPAFMALLAASLIPFHSIPSEVRLPSRLILPLLLNSLLVGIFGDWVIRALARRRGLGSLSTSGAGIGFILGFVFTLNMIRLMGLYDTPTSLAISTQAETLSTFASMLVIAIFETALAVGIMIAIAWITERLFKSYTTGFYWSFVAIVILELMLTILRQPRGLIGDY